MKHALMLALVLLVGCAAQPTSSDATRLADEQAVQKWFDDWIAATEQGDLPLVLSLIADDVVFLVPGVGVMDKQGFAAASASDSEIEFGFDCSVREIQVLGDHAWIWAEGTVTMRDTRTQVTTTMAGHSLSILERRGDRWVVIRDANTMLPVEPGS